MRIRKAFAGAFTGLALLAGYTGLAPISIPYSQFHSDKVLHFLVFFLLTLLFYWILDTSRRRVLHLTLVVCTLCGGIGSEILQAILPNGRDFDYLDIAANLVGSLAALGINAAYHKRLMERKRAVRGYGGLAGDEETAIAMEDATELQEGTGSLQTGVTGDPGVDLDDELDHWDENEEDEWDNQQPKPGEAGAIPAIFVNGHIEAEQAAIDAKGKS